MTIWKHYSTKLVNWCSQNNHQVTKTALHIQPYRPFLGTTCIQQSPRPTKATTITIPRVPYFHLLSQHLQQHRECLSLSFACKQSVRRKATPASAISDQFHRSTNIDPGCWAIDRAVSVRFLSATYFRQSVSVFKNLCPCRGLADIDQS